MEGVSYELLVDKDGSLPEKTEVVRTLDTTVDVYETVEEMYGMIWRLAQQVSFMAGRGADPVAIVEDSRVNYQLGLRFSPTERYNKENL